MGLHASYHPIQPAKLFEFISTVHSEECWLREVSRYREESTKNGHEFYIGTTWHVIDFIINQADAFIPELAYSVRGHEFPAPDGSVRLEAHLPSYNDEYWQAFTYVTAEEAVTIAQYLPLINDTEFFTRFLPEKMKDIYRAPSGMEGGNKEYYFELLVGLQAFYKKIATDGMAVLIDMG